MKHSSKPRLSFPSIHSQKKSSSSHLPPPISSLSAKQNVIYNTNSQTPQKLSDDVAALKLTKQTDKRELYLTQRRREYGQEGFLIDLLLCCGCTITFYEQIEFNERKNRYCKMKYLSIYYNNECLFDRQIGMNELNKMNEMHCVSDMNEIDEMENNGNCNGNEIQNVNENERFEEMNQMNQLTEIENQIVNEFNQLKEIQVNEITIENEMNDIQFNEINQNENEIEIEMKEINQLHEIQQNQLENTIENTIQNEMKLTQIHREVNDIMIDILLNQFHIQLTMDSQKMFFSTFESLKTSINGYDDGLDHYDKKQIIERGISFYDTLRKMYHGEKNIQINYFSFKERFEHYQMQLFKTKQQSKYISPSKTKYQIHQRFKILQPKRNENEPNEMKTIQSDEIKQSKEIKEIKKSKEKLQKLPINIPNNPPISSKYQQMNEFHLHENNSSHSLYLQTYGEEGFLMELLLINGCEILFEEIHNDCEGEEFPKQLTIMKITENNCCLFDRNECLSQLCFSNELQASNEINKKEIHEKLKQWNETEETLEQNISR